MKRITGGRGADVVFEATVSPDAARATIHAVAFGGTVALAGITAEETVTFDTHLARRKGVTLRWVRRSKLAVEPAMALAASGRVPLDGLVTHRFPLGDVQTAFETVAGYKDHVMKAVVLPNR